MGRLASVDFVDPLLNTDAQMTSVVSSTAPPTIIDHDVVNPQQRVNATNSIRHRFIAATTSNSIQDTIKGDDAETATTTPIITMHHLPRSVRWRLNLQLLVSPPALSFSAMVHNDDNITTTSNHNNNATTTAAAAAAVEEAMQSIVNVNTDKLQSQRERYVNIEKEYYWKCTPTIISTADNNDDVSSPSTLMESSSSSRRLAPQVVPLGDDPLSAFIHRPSLTHEEEEQHQHQYTNNSNVETRETNSLRQNNVNTNTSSSSSSSRWSEFYNTRELINLIYMDIHRLPCDHSSSSSSSNNNNKEERGENIVHILYLYARLYPNIGYRQGMHEIVSYILLVFEMDYCLITNNKNQKLVNTGTNLLLDSTYILHDTFTLFECIMSSLVHAYDVVLPSSSIAAAALPSSLLVPKVSVSPMEDMTVSILDQIRRGGGGEGRGEELYNYLLYTIPVPPQLYISKWIRLMFTREIAGSGGGGSNIPMVLNLWDEFFDLTASQCLTSCSVSISIALLDVLKTAACGMILLMQHELLVVGRRGGSNNQEESNMNLLMNYPPIQDIQPLVDIIRTNALSGQYGTNAEELLPSSPLKEFHDPLGVIQRSVLHDPSYGANNNITENYFIGHSNDEYSHHPITATTAHPIQLQDVAESLGSIAEGLLHFGARAASSAIAKAKEQYEVHIDSKAYYKQFSHGHHQQHQQQQQYDLQYHHHPLQQGDNSIIASHSRRQTGYSSSHHTARGEDTISITYRPREEGLPNQPQQQQQQQQSNVKLMTNVIVDKIANVDTSSCHVSRIKEVREETMTQGGDSNNSSISNRKSPHELASLLEQSVSTLMTYYNGRRSNMSDEIFDAIVTINLVKKELLLLQQQST